MDLESPRVLGPNSFILSATAPTDLWRTTGNPPIDRHDAETWTVPVVLHQSFRRLRATIHADWTREGDQGGLVILAGTLGPDFFWVKCGIEIFDGEPYVSCVTADVAADRSFAPGLVKDGKATLELANVNDILWLYYIADDGMRVPLRQITWFIYKRPHYDVDVGIYAARPVAAGEGCQDEELVVRFDDVVIEY